MNIIRVLYFGRNGSIERTSHVSPVFSIEEKASQVIRNPFFQYPIPVEGFIWPACVVVYSCRYVQEPVQQDILSASSTCVRALVDFEDLENRIVRGNWIVGLLRLKLDVLLLRFVCRCSGWNSRIWEKSSMIVSEGDQRQEVMCTDQGEG